MRIQRFGRLVPAALLVLVAIGGCGNDGGSSGSPVGRFRRFLNRARADLAAAENRSLPADVCAMLSAGLYPLAGERRWPRDLQASLDCLADVRRRLPRSGAWP